MRFWFLEELQADPQFAILKVLIVVFSICSHEYMHARTALWQGDDTAKLLGHLTLNPLKQMGPMSLIMMFVIGIAFGKVPVNPSKFRSRYGDAIVSFAGPFTNLMLFFAFCGGCIVAYYTGSQEQIQFILRVFIYGAMLNGALFLLNMVPVPPLDGHGILCSFIPSLKTTSSEILNGASFFILIVIFFSASYLFLASIMGIFIILKAAGVIENIKELISLIQ
jgi:Zn-dependent protease